MGANTHKPTSPMGGEGHGQNVYVTNFSSVNGASFVIPEYDSQTFTYVGAGAADGDKIATQVFKKGSTVVATLTYSYFGSTDNVSTIVQT